jgi:nitrogen fixation protein NifU and related proteins
MLRALRLVWLLMRRMAVRLWLLFFIGVAMHGGLRTWHWTYLAGMAALAGCYVSGASLNDIDDEAIDRINLPDATDRPLVSGEATRSEMAALAAISAAVALVAAAAFGPAGVGLIAIGLVIGVTYSTAPLRLARRTFAAPAILAAGYVLLSYGLGAVAAGRGFGRGDVAAAALFLVYVGRINLKDFRDRAGDAAYGRRPALLRFGRSATCVASAVLLLMGDGLLVWAIHPAVVIIVLVQLYVVAVAITLLRLFEAANGRSEQAAIALGARMGDGLLLLILADLVMAGLGASDGETALLGLAIAGGSALTFVSGLNEQPELVVEDLYKAAVLDHSRDPRNNHPLPNASFSSSRSNPYCGDQVTVHVRIEDGALEEVAFEGQGCSISQASASMMTEAVDGLMVADAARLAERFSRVMSGEMEPGEAHIGALVALGGVAKHPARVKCAVLPWDVLRSTFTDAGSPSADPVLNTDPR